MIMQLKVLEDRDNLELGRTFCSRCKSYRYSRTGQEQQAKSPKKKSLLEESIKQLPLEQQRVPAHQNPNSSGSRSLSEGN